MWRNTCSHCGHIHDSTYSRCPKCNSDQGGDGRNFFDNMLHVNIFKQIGFLLLALIGLTVVSTIVQSIQMVMFKTDNPSAGAEEIKAYLMSAPNLFASNTIAYLSLFLIMGLLLWSGWKELLGSFKNWKAYAFAAAGFGAIMVFSVIYNALVSNIYQALGRELPSTNNNQSLINEMILFQPFACLIVFGLIGPLTEEFAYRVGLFGAATRFGKVFGYIITVLVFASIHFDFTAFSDSAALESELIALPSYLFSGFAFSFLYQKFGFASSFLAHATNNVFSIVVNYMQMTLKQ